MKKILMGLTALLAISFAVPAFAADEPAAGGEPKKEKKMKKGKKGKEGEKPAEGAK